MVLGKPEVIKLAVVALLAEGHVLIEDVPGVGKPSLAQVARGQYRLLGSAGSNSPLTCFLGHHRAERL